MANFAWLDQLLAERDPARERALLRAVTEALVSEVQARIGLDVSRDIEHRCYELLNAPSTEIEPPPVAPPAGGPYREPAPTKCARCGRQIAESESNITESGVVCDRCFVGGG